MLKTVEGVFSGGRVDLLEAPEVTDGTPVLVTFLRSQGVIDLHERGIDEQQAAALRWRLHTFAEDWDDPAMAVYDEP